MSRFLFPNRFAPLSAAVAAALLAGSLSLHAQVTGSSQTTTNPDGSKSESITLSTGEKKSKKRKGTEEKESKKDEKVQQSADTKAAQKKRLKQNPLADMDANLPDKQLYDKAVAAMNKGHYDVARLDLQTMLNTYPDSPYQMRAKLAVADSWYKEGGSAALAQAEAEYKDFITFFPNVPEAAEAQMRVGDIYFRQMDKPDRDYQKAIHAQEEYRNMVQQFPQSTLVPQAKQRLREVQEVLATRETEIATFYAGHENWAAAIARYQTVSDTYPLFSRMDEVLIGLGDGYAAQSRFVQNSKTLPEGPRAQLLKQFDDLALAAYTKVITEHSASAHVEDARDRIEALGRPQPEATPEQLAASQALEGSRSSYKLIDRAKIMVLRRPDVVQTAHIGEPTLVDPRATLAPEVTKRTNEMFTAAMNPNAAAINTSPAPAAAAAAVATAPAENAAPVAAPAGSAPALSFQDVPAADGSSAPASSGSGSFNAAPAAATGASGSGVGLEIVQPKPGEAQPTYGLKPVGGDAVTALPPVEAPAAPIDTVNDVAGQKTPVAQQAPADGKKAKKPSLDKSEESSSKNKKKKGLGKLNPF